MCSLVTHREERQSLGENMCIDSFFSLAVEFLNHVNKFRAQYKLYVFKDLKVRNKFETE